MISQVIGGVAPGPGSRLRTAAAVVLLVAAVLAGLVVVTWLVLLRDLDAEARATLDRETGQFEQFSRSPTNPETRKAFSAARELMRVHLARQGSGEHQVLAGVPDDGRPPMVQGQDDAVRALTGGGAIEAILADPAPDGTLVTEEGELRWVKTPVRVPGDAEAGRPHFVAGFL
ncbi:MAG TPA: hypothetical protein VD813_03885, partial [Pseudonocardia sp.]|nr:hypothetical protein [Pseudonocardia sp.]